MSFLGGFLFGNVNEEGNIDDDFFDEEIKETLAGANLSSLGLDLAVLNDRESSSTTSSSTTQHASNAVDFSDIQEVADDDFTGAESVIKKDRRPSVGVDETTDEEDFLIEQAVANSTLPSTFKVPAPIVRGAAITTSHQTPYKSSFPSNRDRISNLTPSSMQIRIGELPDELQAIFPSFERNKILNFSDLFMPTVGLRNPPQSDVSVQIAKKHFTTVQDTRSLFDSSLPDSVRGVPATSQILEVLAQKLLILGVLPADLMDYIESWDDRDDTIKKLILVERYLPESPSEYFPVVLENWEDKIVWDSDTLPDAPIDSLISEKYQFPDGLRHIPQNEEKTETSIFPVKNYELEFGSWTDSIMWDDRPTNISDDQVVELDMNDPFLQFDLAKFVDQEENATAFKFRRASVSENVDFDRFNLSNDNYYDHVYADKATTVSKTLGSLALQHAVPAVRLARSLYKTYLTKSDLRRFHRPHIRFSTGETITISKTKLLKKKKIKGKDPSELMKHVRDLTLRDTAGFVLAEFSEEFPPVMSKPGMASLIYNYYRKKSDNDTSLGETKTQGTPFVLTPTDASPFLGFGDVAPGQTIQTLYNNLFRAPIFQHEAKTTDYLLIKWKLGNEVKYFVREIPALFVVGQVFPMVEIPRPQARLNKEIERNRIKVQAIRLINQDPKKEKLNFKTLHKSFNYQTEIQLRQRIKEFMEAWKKNQSTGLWKLKGNQKLLSEEELRGLVTPEMVCLYEAMKAGQQQLSDAGYADNSAADNADVEDTSLLSVEQQLAPWMTSRHFLMASQGKAMVEVHGAGDPTGRGEGFSFVKRSMKGMFLRAGETEEDRMKDGERSRVNVNEQWEVYREEVCFLFKVCSLVTV
ncbi:hypothetical protein BKA69DRAFT_1060407 [Paraphysoderma sedebokerense]|nr:hypothetical protein BKA69DRAFT_1060407 [Paraphysoderma sedebokerense]